MCLYHYVYVCECVYVCVTNYSKQYHSIEPAVHNKHPIVKMRALPSPPPKQASPPPSSPQAIEEGTKKAGGKAR